MKYLLVFIVGLISGRVSILFLEKLWDCNFKVINRYPLVEVVTAAGYCGIYYLLAFNLSSFFYSFLFSSLVIITLTDLKHYLIPNSVVLTMFILALVFHLTTHPFNIYNAWLSFLCAGLFFLSLQILSKGGLGGGDIKLIAVLGLWFGFPNIALIIFLSALFASLVGISLILVKLQDKNQPLAYGPFLVMATLIVFLVGDQIWTFYLRAF